MIQVEDKIISFDVFEKQFVCDLSACKGACCVEGDSGAPLDDDEIPILTEVLDAVKPYMQEKGIAAIEQHGVYVVDSDGDKTTPLIDDNECAFVTFDKDGTAKCSIEQAHHDGKVNFKKPISCHLFPIRIQSYRDFEAVNYEAIDICKPACDCGEKLQIPVFRFLKEPLIRKYGEQWYDQLNEVQKHLKRNNQNHKF